MGRNQLASELKQSVQHIRTALKLLSDMKILTIQTTNQFSIITLVNYDKYQSDAPDSTSEITQGQPTANQRLTTDKEVKKVEKEKKEPLTADAVAATAIASKGKELRDFFWAEYQRAFGRTLTWTHAKDIIQRERALVEAQGLEEACRLARNYIASTYIASPTYRAFLADPDKYNVPMMKFATGPKSDFQPKPRQALPAHIKLPPSGLPSF